MQENQGHAAGAGCSVGPCAFRATYDILCVAASQKLGMVCCSSTCIKQAVFSVGLKFTRLMRYTLQYADKSHHMNSTDGGLLLKYIRPTIWIGEG
jgi:hypothetical protein